MTINKPQIVSWGSFYKGVMQDFGYNEAATKAAAELDFHGRTLSIEPLIRLSAYESRMAVLFDGHSVYNAMAEKSKQHTSPESVAAVLDAVVKLMREVSDDNQ